MFLADDDRGRQGLFSSSMKAAGDAVLLLLGTSTIPINDVDKLPGISAELKLKLTLFVDDQLGSRVKDSPLLFLSVSFKSTSPAVKL
jgi:hypothetical protein